MPYKLCQKGWVYAMPYKLCKLTKCARQIDRQTELHHRK